jgi:hypothetical protein
MIPSDTALLCVYYPQQLLPGLAAVVQCRLHQGAEFQAPTTILVWSDPGVGDTVLRQRQQAFDILLRAFPWATLVFLGANEIKTHLSPNFRVAAKARYLCQRFGAGAFASVFYAHDIGSDYIAQSAMQAFPQATRVCFGDALGVVYSNNYYTRLTYPLGPIGNALRRPRQTLSSFFWRVKRAYTLPRRSDRLDAHCAALILSSDPGGDFLPGKELLPITRHTLDSVLDGLAQGVEYDLSRRSDTPQAAYADKHLLLLGSFSESGFTSAAQEQAMYLDVVRQYIPPGATLVLKAHPASYGEKVRGIAQTLAAHCKVELTATDALPIEALRSLAACRSIISFSYSSVSLHYLYGSHVVHAMTAQRIKQYFPPHIRPWMQESNALYLEQLTAAARLRQEQLGAAVIVAPDAPVTTPVPVGLERPDPATNLARN